MQGKFRVLVAAMALGLLSACGTDPSEPSIHTAAPEAPRIVAVAAGASHSLALRSDGTVWAWGANSSGQLGNGTEDDSPTPQPVKGLSDAIAIAAGRDHSLALKRDGTVWAWGSNSHHQLGNGGDRPIEALPVQVFGLTDVTAVDAAGDNSMALRGDGTVWVWGSNSYYQLGLAELTLAVDVGVPTQVPGLSNASEVACGRLSYSLAVQEDGTLWAWGWNRWIALNVDPTEETVRWPAQVKNIQDVLAAAGAARVRKSVMALKRDGTVWTWGDGFPPNPPQQMTGLHDVVAIAAGGDNLMALEKDGTVWVWGNNRGGNLGIGKAEMKEYTVPQRVADLPAIVAIASGEEGTSMAVGQDGTVWAWGTNDHGQLGDGTQESRKHPVRVVFW